MNTRGRSSIPLCRKPILGYASLALGVAGLVLPIIPGVVFILIGLRLLGPEHYLDRPVMRLMER